MADQASPVLESSGYTPGLEDGIPMPEQHLTVLLVGESGLGKTRWVYNVAAAHGIDMGGSINQGCSQGLPRLPSTNLSRTASFASCPARWATDLQPLQLPGGSGRLRLCLQDSPGHCEETNKARHLAALLEHVLRLRERDYRAVAAAAAEGPPPPPPLHSAVLCLYFVHPSGPTPLDLAYMAALARELPLLPLVARVDSLRPEELAAAARELAAQMEAYTRGGYASPIRTMQLQGGCRADHGVLAVGAEHPQHTDMALLDHLVGGGVAAAALQQAPARLHDFASDYEAMGCDLMGLLAWRVEAVEGELASAAAALAPRALPEPLPCSETASALAAHASPAEPAEPTKTASPLRVVAAIEHIVRQLSRSIMGPARAEGAAGASTTTSAKLAAEGVDVHISLPEDGRGAGAAVEKGKRTSATASEDKSAAATTTSALHDSAPAQDLLTLTLAEGVATSLLAPSQPSPQPACDASLLTSGFAAAAATAVASATPSASMRGARQDRSPSAVGATLQAARSDATVTAASQAFFPSPASSTFGSASDGWIDLEDLAEQQQQQQQQQRGRDEAAVCKRAAVATFEEDRLSPTCGSAAKVYRNALYGEEVQEQEGGVAGAGVGYGLAEGEEEDEDVAVVRAVVRRALAMAVAAEEDRTCVPALVQRVFACVRAAGECAAGSSSGSKGWFLSSLRVSLPRMANLSTVWVTASTAPAKSAPAAPAFTRAYSLSSGSLTHMASYRYGAMAAASAACAATAAVLLARRRV